jgi:hypothetical protein
MVLQFDHYRLDWARMEATRFSFATCANLHNQLPNNEDNLVHLLEDPENWSTICHFFNQLEIEVSSVI